VCPHSWSSSGSIRRSIKRSRFPEANAGLFCYMSGNQFLSSCSVSGFQCSASSL
ncbi:hypothetical protein AMECASPLE_030871, partial [Ameca splendens]